MSDSQSQSQHQANTGPSYPSGRRRSLAPAPPSPAPSQLSHENVAGTIESCSSTYSRVQSEDISSTLQVAMRGRPRAATEARGEIPTSEITHRPQTSGGLTTSRMDPSKSGSGSHTPVGTAPPSVSGRRTPGVWITVDDIYLTDMPEIELRKVHHGAYRAYRELIKRSMPLYLNDEQYDDWTAGKTRYFVSDGKIHESTGSGEPRCLCDKPHSGFHPPHLPSDFQSTSQPRINGVAEFEKHMTSRDQNLSPSVQAHQQCYRPAKHSVVLPKDKRLCETCTEEWKRKYLI